MGLPEPTLGATQRSMYLDITNLGSGLAGPAGARLRAPIQAMPDTAAYFRSLWRERLVPGFVSGQGQDGQRQNGHGSPSEDQVQKAPSWNLPQEILVLLDLLGP